MVIYAFYLLLYKQIYIQYQPNANVFTQAVESFLFVLYLFLFHALVRLVQLSQWRVQWAALICSVVQRRLSALSCFLRPTQGSVKGPQGEEWRWGDFGSVCICVCSVSPILVFTYDYMSMPMCNCVCVSRLCPLKGVLGSQLRKKENKIRSRSLC